jgi:hypothetical protein
MSAKAGLRQSVLSTLVFVIVLAGLVSVDARVRDRFSNLMTGGDGLGHRLSELGEALVSAARYQSMENGSLLIFATVGIVLFLFLVRS